MRLKPNYSLEFNEILNPTFSEQEQVINFASLLSDKDRFLSLLPVLEKNYSLIEKKMGSKLPGKIEFFVVRAEKFKSFSFPICIEYSILPEEMFVYLLKEILKSYAAHRFPDNVTREVHINSLVDYIIINGDFGKLDLIKYSKNLHEESKHKYPQYNFSEIDYSKKTLKEYIEDLYDE